MTLAPGTRLGPYAVQSALGAGGMGEVYKATDTRLDRTVAIKVLPGHVAADPALTQRFEREAKALAALNHPHICHIHDVGRQDGIDFLVMECLDGETLEQRLKKGALPLDQALQVGIQIADALAAAHRAGIVHRDLKPGNVMLTKAGAKLLDFGLAKAGAQAVAGSLSMLPTTPPNLTAHGAILGTFQYMAPEQIEGQDADTRTDIFAFGAVVYEMVTGKKAFEGKSQASLIAAILEHEPASLSTLQPLAPPVADALIRKCLAKKPDDRWQAASDLGSALRWAVDAGSSRVPAAPLPRKPLWRRLALPVGAALLASAVVSMPTWFAARPADQVPPRVSRLSLASSGAAALNISNIDRDLAITPDGSRVVYVGNRGTQLFVRALDSLEPVAVFTGAPRGPFVSPDGQWIGFVDLGRQVKKVAMTGGPAVMLATLDSAPRGATWGPDDTIIFATATTTAGLQRVAAAGAGPTTVLTRPDRAQGEAGHLWPEMLPGGRAVLFTVAALTGGLDASLVAVLDLDTGVQKTLVRGGSHAHYVSSGHLVYAAAGTLRAVAFDLAGLETRGTPVPVVPDVVRTAAGAVDAVVASDGTLVYVSGGVAAGARTLVWVDRQGRETPIAAPSRTYVYPRLSPDATRIAVYAADQEADIWVWDLGRNGPLARATFSPGLDIRPVWTPDGRRVIFGSDRTGETNLFWHAADGTGAVERLTDSPNQHNATAVSPDGRRLILTESGPKTGDDVMQLDLDGPHRMTPLVQSPFIERNGIISPDGRWLAYEANDSGRFEIWVRPFPEVSRGYWQVSTGGGTRPLWARSGQELFYASPTGALMRVGVERVQSWAATTPTLLVKEGYVTTPGANTGRTYDVSPDGQRFLMIKEGGGMDQTAVPPQIIVVQHWTEELKRLVPIK